METSADEDQLSIDMLINTPSTDIRVQVKCTHGDFTKRTETINFKVKDHWRSRWEANRNPIYVVVVRVPKGVSAGWIEHVDETTLHRSSAYWFRVEPTEVPSQIRVPKSQPLTALALAEWETYLLDEYSRPSS